MISKSCSILLLSISLTLVNALPEAFPHHLLQQRQEIKATSPFDHAWIDHYTALGDSYSVGLGAGHAVKENAKMKLNSKCSQYSNGYPNILNGHEMLGPNPNRNFQYLGCSGALVPDITKKQVPLMENAQLVTLSAGGNDAHLATILNYCIYQWFTGWFWSCDGELKSAKDAIEAKSYSSDMVSLMDAISKKLQSPNSRIYWVGYERFFDTSTKDCDSVTWAFTRNYGFRQYLTQDRRNKMNALVDDVNSKIKDVCSKTDKCIYVENNDAIDLFQGHYCEPKVDESYHWPGGGRAANREQTWFYEWGTDKDNDSDGEKKIDQPQKRQNAPSGYDNSTFEGSIANWIAKGQQTQEIDPALGVQDISIKGSALPDSYGRVFHLDKFANSVVAFKVLKAMDVEQGKIMKQPLVTKTLTCGGVTAATATPVKCSISSNRDIGPYCNCDDGRAKVTAKPIAKPPPGKNQCDYSTMPKGNEILTAIHTTIPSPSPTSPHAPYATKGNIGVAGATDKCHVHLWQYWSCGGNAINYRAAIELYDAAGNQLLKKTDEQSINADKPGSFKSKLENSLVITGEHQGEYVQFTNGGTSWRNTDADTSKPSWCASGGWDPKGGPSCGRFGTTRSTKQMDCYFPCPYNGRGSSDAT